MFERLRSLEASVKAHADFLIDERVSELAVDMRKNPADYKRYHEAQLDAACAEKALRDAIGEQPHLLKLLTEMKETIYVREGVEYEYIYSLGFMDGGRIYHAFTTHELPKSMSRNKGKQE